MTKKEQIKILLDRLLKTTSKKIKKELFELYEKASKEIKNPIAYSFTLPIITAIYFVNLAIGLSRQPMPPKNKINLKFDEAAIEAVKIYNDYKNKEE